MRKSPASLPGADGDSPRNEETMNSANVVAGTDREETTEAGGFHGMETPDAKPVRPPGPMR